MNLPRDFDNSTHREIEIFTIHNVLFEYNHSDTRQLTTIRTKMKYVCICDCSSQQQEKQFLLNKIRESVAHMFRVILSERMK